MHRTTKSVDFSVKYLEATLQLIRRHDILHLLSGRFSFDSASFSFCVTQQNSLLLWSAVQTAHTLGNSTSRKSRRSGNSSDAQNSTQQKKRNDGFFSWQRGGNHSSIVFARSEQFTLPKLIESTSSEHARRVIRAQKTLSHRRRFADSLLACKTVVACCEQLRVARPYLC